jgi:tetratricopeptide (TPR) repeat protein
MDFCKRTRVVIGASALLLVAGAALADNPAPFPECTKTPSADDVEAAKQSHTIATSRFNLQDWDKAIEFWRQAYGLDCTAHALLVNIANAYEKKGDKRAAVAALETYLVRATGAPDLVKVNERVVDLKKSLEPAPTATATATATATVIPTATATATAPPPSGARPFGPIPLVVAGVGGAIAIVGAILIPVGLGPYNEAFVDCPDPSDCDDPAVRDKANNGRVLWNAGGALLGVGVAAAAGGLGWHFLFNKPQPVASAPAAPPKGAAPKPTPTKARLDVMPVVSPQVGGVVVTGKF